MCRWATLALIFGLLATFAGSAVAQDSPVITVGNIERLTSVREIDFDRLPERAGEIINGRVYLSADGTILAVVNRDGQVVLLDDAGNVLAVSDVILTPDGFPATFIDGVFAADRDLFASIHTAGDRYFVSFMTLKEAARVVEVPAVDKPVAIWLDGDVAWLEVIPDAPGEAPYLVQIPQPAGDPSITWVVSETDLTTSPFVPAGDADAVARIGRLPLPIAVTVTEAGQVKRWNLQTGQLTGMAQVAEIPIYGYTTPDGRWLLWRDPASVALHLLDFSTGEDRVVVALDHAYIPFMFLTPRADVALGVYVDDQPSVVAWTVPGGERHDLGLFRQCQRPPDMVRLGLGGTALVIGCDAGLDIWRIGD